MRVGNVIEVPEEVNTDTYPWFFVVKTKVVNRFNRLSAAVTFVFTEPLEQVQQVHLLQPTTCLVE